MNTSQLEIQKKMQGVLFKNSVHTSFYNLALAIAFIYLLPNVHLLTVSTSIWFLLMILAVLSRFLSGYYSKQLNYKYAYYIQLVSIFMTGILWAWVYWFFYDANNQFQQMLILLLLIGISAASIVSMAPSKMCYLAFSLPVILSVLITNLLITSPNSIAVITLALIYYLFLVTLHRQNHQLLLSNYNLEIKRGRLISILNKKNQTDHLTGLLNRKSFKFIAEKELLKAKHSKQYLSIILCDIDYFKQINDKYGHHMGDEVLKYISIIFKEKFKQYPIARIGGDEFAILVTGLYTSNEIELVARNILNSIASEISIKHYQIRIGLSLGIASYPSSGSSIEKLERSADISLYKAKELGRNQYVIFSDELYQDYIKNEIIYDAILQPFEQSFTFHYQPIYQIANETQLIKGVELLIRSKIDFDKPIHANDILSVADRRGLVIQFGFYTFKMALNEIRSLIKRYKNYFFSINISTKLIEDTSNRKKMLSLIEYYGINPQKIILEITETSLFSCHQTTLYALNELKNYGFRIAIDDFGKGHSSLSRLSNLPADILKLDMEFIKKITDDFNVYIIVKWIIQLTHNLNMQIIAEGIETIEQYNMLQSLECNLMQGYLLAKPLTKNQLITHSTTSSDTTPN
ncbi:MAG: EAL domain-containing protein [Gammaproteobacteria bacterium]|nr:MAG: EAL domain-containing protein [Gammaproteobacteria bacterium]UTW42006.1 EAL domain-containing protein [bacterium SCSIO 12844]